MRPIEEKDVFGDWWRWLNDTKVTGMMDKGYEENTPEKQLAYYQKVEQSDKDAVFAICHNESDQHIGTIGLHDIQLKEGTAQFGVIIGNTDYHGQGIGKNTWEMVTKWGFHTLNIHTIRTMIVPDNVASMKIAEKLGYKVTEVYPEFIKKPGKNYDYTLLHLKRADWEKTRQE